MKKKGRQWILKTSTFIKADENGEYKIVDISSISLKEIGEQLQPSDSEDNSKVEWKVPNIWKTVWKMSYTV